MPPFQPPWKLTMLSLSVVLAVVVAVSVIDGAALAATATPGAPTNAEPLTIAEIEERLPRVGPWEPERSSPISRTPCSFGPPPPLGED